MYLKLENVDYEKNTKIMHITIRGWNLKQLHKNKLFISGLIKGGVISESIFNLVPSKVIYTKYTKQFKWNSYFYVSGQNRPFWAVLKLL